MWNLFLPKGSSGGSGNVVGPASSTDNAVARFDGATGKLIQNSGVIVDDSNNVLVPSLDASMVIITDGSKNLDSSSVTSTSLEYLLNAEPLTSATLIDNTVVATSFATWAHATYQSIQIEYSIARGTGIRESGTIYLATDGTTAGISQSFAAIGASGVTFTTDINGANIRLLYTTTSTGIDATMKYTVRKWLV